jgi:hypothetical protein
MSIGERRCILILNSNKPQFTTKAPRHQGLIKNKINLGYSFHLSWCLPTPFKKMLGKWAAGGACALVVIFGFPFIAWAQEPPQWVLLPSQLVFRPLIADPREIHDSVSANGAWDTYEGDIGDIIELLQWRPLDGSRWGWGIEGASDIQLDGLGNGVFPERVSDWYLGTYFSESYGQISNRLEYLHVSSHLGDSLFAAEPRIIFTRESFRWTTSYDPSRQVRVYAGVGYYPHMAPDDQRFYAHWGAELYSEDWPVIGTVARGYFGYDGKYLREAGGVLDQNFELGVQWKWTPDSTRAIRVAVSYYAGNSDFGQFYRQSDNHWGWGVYFDP